MLVSTVLAASLLAPVFAAPYAVLRQRQIIEEPVLNITYSSPVNSSLPTVVIFATGGTIAGSSASATDTTNYSAGVIGVEALVQAVPQLLNVSNIIGSQVSNTASGNINSTIILTMAKLANQLLCSANSTVDGLIITHGTDTLEETAAFMDFTVNCDKPVVVVGAMRPASAISADGPANLLEAVTTAASPEAKGRGALIVLNDRISQAFYTSKTNANVLDTFRATEQGYAGGFLSNKPFFYQTPSQPTFKNVFNVSGIESLPKVDVLISYQDFDFLLIPAAVAAGVKGIVIGGTGAGSLTTAARPYVEAAMAAGIPIVMSSKTNAGAVPPSGGTGTISSGFLNPVKSRLQLQLAIASGMGMEQIRELFEAKLAAFL